jgi:hypothetical protein
MPRFLKIGLFGILLLNGSWGFFGHEKINRLAVFTLPPEMIGFYKKNIQYLTEASVNPDRRRYAIPEEAPRHFIDIDDYGDSAIQKLPRYWDDAVKKYGEGTLEERGIVPWHITRMYYRLKDAFLVKDPKRILSVSAELGHYVADANVPLHTTKNYNGQLTNQVGIHALWESRLPELFSSDYNFFVGKASHIDNIQLRAWKAIAQANHALDSVLKFEKQLFKKNGNSKFNFETKGKQTIKVVSPKYAEEYHRMLSGMVERQMKASIKMVGDIWFTAWVDAGQPDLKSLINYTPSEEELKQRKEELKIWKAKTIKAREHDDAD